MGATSVTTGVSPTGRSSSVTSTLSMGPEVPVGASAGGGTAARTQTVTVSGPSAGTSPAIRMALRRYAPIESVVTYPEIRVMGRPASPGSRRPTKASATGTPPGPVTTPTSSAQPVLPNSKV